METQVKQEPKVEVIKTTNSNGGKDVKIVLQPQILTVEKGK